MHRFAGGCLPLLLTVCTLAQTSSQPLQSSDGQAVSLAQRSIAALVGTGTAISDVTLKATVISLLGSDYETGTAMLRAKGAGKSRIDLNLDKESLLETRTTFNGFPSGGWARDGKSQKAFAQHNCWTDAAWFFPALSSLSQTANPRFVFKYIGPEMHNGISAQHIRIVQLGSNDRGLVQRLSKMDFYLDTNSTLPLALAFNLHADDNMNINLPTEIRFANYRSVNRVNVPFHFQKLINGSVVLDVTVTSAVVNSGVSDNLFTNGMTAVEGNL